MGLVLRATDKLWKSFMEFVDNKKNIEYHQTYSLNTLDSLIVLRSSYSGGTLTYIRLAAITLPARVTDTLSRTFNALLTASLLPTAAGWEREITSLNLRDSELWDVKMVELFQGNSLVHFLHRQR